MRVPPTVAEPRIAGSTLFRGACAAGGVEEVVVTSGEAFEAIVCTPRLFEAVTRIRIRRPRSSTVRV